MEQRTSELRNACDPPLQGGARAVGTRARVRNELLPPEGHGGEPSYNLRSRGAIPRRATTEHDEIGTAETNPVPTLHPENSGNDTTTASENDVEAMHSPVHEASQGRRRRFKWTQEMHLHLYRSYLSITRMETQAVQYGHLLHDEMVRKFPVLRDKTIQNIIDQRRHIFKTNRLTPEVVNRIKNEVATELGLTTVTPHETDETEEQLIVLNNEEQEAHNLLMKNLHYYGGMDPNMRPRIPRLKTTNQSKEILKNVNKVLSTLATNNQTLHEYHDNIYAAAITTLELHHQLAAERNEIPRTGTNRPAWENRLTKKIDNTRKEIGIITEYTRMETPTTKLSYKAKSILDRHKNTTNTTYLEILDMLKQRLKILAHRLRKYRESYKRRTDNIKFQTSQQHFYRSLNQQQNTPTASVNELPDDENIKDFWSKIWEEPAEYKKTAEWLTAEKRRADRINQMPHVTITTADLEEILSGCPNWKAPGPDKLQNFWYKRFSSTHSQLVKLYNDILIHPENTPDFMTKGITYLLPKTSPTTPDPSKYRPITCLPTLYKILTGILANKIYKHVSDNKIMAEEQKGCKKEARGYKEQLIIDAVLTKDALKNKKDLFSAYIDYQKAFDSVPHSWLLDCLTMYKINPQITNFLKTTMKKWETNLLVTGASEKSTAINMKIRRGIFQGDALSALWFCIAINPLSAALNSKKNGYKVTNTDMEISHLLYMDDIKIFSSNQPNLKKLLRVTEIFSKDIAMNFGLTKCRVNSIRKGKWQQAEDFALLQRTGGGVIASMEKDERYKYLGYVQSRGIDYAIVKKDLIQTTKSKLKSVLKTKLSGINMVRAINTYVLPTLTSSFGVIKWTATDLEDANRSIRVAFTKHRAHHPKASKERFHLPRNAGGRGIIDLREAHEQQLHGLRRYFHNQAILSPLTQAIVQADNGLTPLNLARDNLARNNEYSQNSQIQQWKQKELHGRYIHILDQTHIDKQASIGWLTRGNLFPETEGFLIAIQDQVIATRSYKKYIIKDPNIEDAKCRMCGNANETIEHLINGCTTLAARDYTNRHNNVAKIIHREICSHYTLLENTTAYYKYQPDSIKENDACLVYWDRELLTHMPVQHNRPDIFVHDKKKKKVFIIDIAVPTAANIQRKITEKIQKYQPLAEDIKRTWQVESVVTIPIIIGSTGEIPKNLSNNLKMLNIKSNSYLEMQKAAILGTCNILRKVLNIQDTATQLPP